MNQNAVIIGGGIVGTSVALALARRGWAVTVLEKEKDVGQGSTARSSSVVRCHYTRPEGIALAHEGQLTWERWPEFTGLESPRAVYQKTGVLFLLRDATTGGAPAESLGMKAEMDSHAIAERIQMMRSAGVEVTDLKGGELRSRFPCFSFEEEGLVGLFEPNSGFVAYPTEAVEDLRDAGLREGVAFRYGTVAIGAEMEWVGGERFVRGIHIQSGDGKETIPSDVIVNCAGPNSHEVNLDLKCPLPLTTAPQRQLIIEGKYDGNLEDVPAMADLAEGFYIRPDKEVFKVGAVLPQHHVDFVQGTDTGSEQADIQEFEDLLLSRLARRAPALQLHDVKTRVSFYDWTVADSYPILDGTDVRGYYAAIGTSGAWFKGAPVMGALLGEKIERDRQGDPSTVVTLPLSGNTLDLKYFSTTRHP